MTVNNNACVEYFGNIILDRLPLTCWVAGGSLLDYFKDGHCDDSKDIDVFFKYVGEYREACAYLRKLGHEQVFSNDFVTNFDVDGYTIQLIGSFKFKDPQDTINKFDFTVCGAAVDKNKVYMLKTFMDDIRDKKLKINTLMYPISTLKRLPRYIKKGFNIANAEILRIADEINQISEESFMEHLYEDNLTDGGGE